MPFIFITTISFISALYLIDFTSCHFTFSGFQSYFRIQTVVFELFLCMVIVPPNFTNGQLSKTVYNNDVDVYMDLNLWPPDPSIQSFSYVNFNACTLNTQPAPWTPSRVDMCALQVLLLLLLLLLLLIFVWWHCFIQ